MNKNFTRGNIFKNIVVFSLPYLLSYFLQTFYGMADLFIAGRFHRIEVEILDGIAIGGQFMHFLTTIIVGLSVGATVAIGHSIGAGDKKKLSLEIGNTITLFIVAAAVLFVVLLSLRRGIVSVMLTPDEAVGECLKYLTICFVGIPFVVAYNIISSIFRGMGNSKVPLYFVAVACLVNIVLDCVFMGKFGMGAEGAAWGTILAQIVSVFVSVIYIIRHKSFEITFSSLKPVKVVMNGILKGGIPIAFQEALIQASFLMLTVIANMRGVNDSAAVGIVEKLMSIIFMVPSAMLSAVSVIGAHNIGAGSIRRAKDTMKIALVIVWAFGAVISAVMLIFSSGIIGLFTEKAVVVEMGTEYLRGYIWDVIVTGTHFCFSGYFLACGKSVYSFIHNAASALLGRIPLAFIASYVFSANLFPMGLAISLGSCISVVICLFLYSYLNKHPEKIMVSEQNPAL